MSTILMARFTSKAKAGRFLHYVPAEVLSDKSYAAALGAPDADVVAACKRCEYVPFESVLAPWFKWARRGGYEDTPLIEVVLVEVDPYDIDPSTYGVSYRIAIDLACRLYGRELRLLLLWAGYEVQGEVIYEDNVIAFDACECGEYPSLAAAVEEDPCSFLHDDVVNADAWQLIGKFFGWQRIADELVSRDFYVLEGHVFRYL